jgi:hypothetical protein
MDKINIMNVSFILENSKDYDQLLKLKGLMDLVVSYKLLKLTPSEIEILQKEQFGDEFFNKMKQERSLA